MKNSIFTFAVIVISVVILVGCDQRQNSDSIQQKQQEEILKEATAQTGMPAIKNFRERKIMKDVLELRDQEGLITYTYLIAEQTGKLRFLGQTLGYPIPYSTQYTNPEKAEYYSNSGWINLPQADPNGLFSPSSAEATWILMYDPETQKASPMYCEPRVVCLTFKLPDDSPLLK